MQPACFRQRAEAGRPALFLKPLNFSDMKSLLNRGLLPLFTFALAAIFFSSCKKDQASELSPVDSTSDKYEKNLTLLDRDGKNSVELLVSSDNEALVNQLSADNFKFGVFYGTAPEASPAPVDDLTQAPSTSGETATLHLTIVRENFEPGVKGVELIIDPCSTNGVTDRAWNVDVWLHHKAPPGPRQRKTKVWAAYSFYVEGVYTGFWPFWQKKYGNFWTTNHTTPWYNTNNLSVHITQVNTNTVNYTYYW